MKYFKILLICTIAAATLTACGEKNENVTNTYSVDEVKSISISSTVEHISINTSDNSDITVSLAGLKDDSCKISDGVLEIFLPEGKAGIHLTSPATLEVNLPAGYSADSITVYSDCGNITIDNINFNNLSVSTATGNITTKDISGNITAGTKTGEFFTKFEDVDTDSAGNKFIGAVGDDSRTVSLITETGNITLE